jgi:hypothetical protein
MGSGSDQRAALDVDQDFAAADMVGGADEPSFSIRSISRAAPL